MKFKHVRPDQSYKKQTVAYKGVFRNTWGGGWETGGGQKSFELLEGGTKNFSALKRRGQKSLAKLIV